MMPTDGATDDVAGVDKIFSIKSISNNASLYRQPGLNNRYGQRSWQGVPCTNARGGIAPALLFVSTFCLLCENRSM